MIECVVISVYDTTLPNTGADTILDFADKGTCRLVYEGSDIKFGAFMASRLEFSLEVNINLSAPDLFYKGLFSGLETRFLVELTDQNDTLLWSGFLLPDQYGEPYTYGTFYVSFIATDGIGRLKGYTLRDQWYQARQSISKILSDCLKKTGLSLEIWMDPALSNNGALKRYDQLYLEGSSWKSGDKKENCYQILEDVIKGFGATLYQQENRWYIAGYNKKNLYNTTLHRYNADGEYIQDVDITSTNEPEFKPLIWYDTPDVTMKPPFKEIALTTGVQQSESLLSENIVRQEWTKTQEPQVPPPSKFWKGTGTGITPELFEENGNAFPTYSSEDLSLTGVVGFDMIDDLLEPALYSYYISLAIKPFIKRSSGVLKLSFQLGGRFNNPGNNVVIENYVNNDHLFYELLVDTTVLASNKTGFASREAYFFQMNFTYSNNNSYLDASLEIELKNVDLDGFLDFRLYNLKDADSDSAWIKNLTITYDQKVISEFTKTRSLDRSNTMADDLHFGDAVMNVANGIVYQPPILDAELTEIIFSVGSITANNQIVTDPILLNTTNFNLIDTNSDRVYVKRFDSDYLEYVHDLTNNGSLLYFIMNLEDGHQIQYYDKIYVRTATGGDPQTTTIRKQREEWTKSTNSNGTMRYGEALAEVMHDVYHSAVIMFEGETKGLIFPRDIISFEFDKLMRNWVTTRIEMVFGENQTRVTALEYKNENVTDYA